MKFFSRFCIIAAVVAGGLAAQGLLYAHLSSAPKIPPGSITRDLSKFPTELAPWRSQDIEMEEKYMYATEHFDRAYYTVENGQLKHQVRLVMVFSEVGADREHHPEVCQQTAGQRELAGDRQLIEVKGHPSPVQQLRFTNGQQSQYVYYWHYTIPPQPVEGLTTTQRIYQEIRNRRASVTLQVFAPEINAQSKAAAIDFVKLADQAIQPFVGPDAIRGHKRLPVTLIRSDAIDEH